MRAAKRGWATRQPGPAVAPIALVAACYWAGAQIGLRLALVHDQVTPLWPPTGIAVVALIVFGPRIWPGIILGAFAANAPIGPTLPAAAGIAVGNTLAPLTAYALMKRANLEASLGRVRDVLVLVFGGLAGMIVSATIGSGILLIAGAITGARFWSTWWVWWTGDAMGVLVVAPCLLLLWSARWTIPSSWLRTAEAIAAITATSVIATILFRTHAHPMFLVFPFMLWIAWRFQIRGVAPTVLAVSIVAILAAEEGAGAFAGESLLRKMAFLQAFNGSLALTAFLISALTAQRMHAMKALERAGMELEDRVRSRTKDLQATLHLLEESETRLEEAQRVGHVGSWEWDISTDSVRWSDELFRLYGLEPRSIDVDFGAFLDHVHPEDRDMVNTTINQAGIDHRPFSFDHRVVRPDGAVGWIHARGTVTLDANGLPRKMLGTAEDLDDRRRAEETERELREASFRHRQALEINDTVVQGLAAAVHGLERGESQRSMQALDRTLEAARTMMANLLGQTTSIAPGDLVRAEPATVLHPPRTASPPRAKIVPNAVRVVIADDTTDVRLLLRTLLEATPGFTIAGEATDGAEAVRLIEELRPELLLLDLAMPVMDGLQVTQQVTARFPGTKIVVLSGYGKEQVAAQVLELGAVAYVEKGKAIGRLTSLLQELFPHARPVSQTFEEIVTPPVATSPPGSDDVVAVYVHELRSPLTALQGLADNLLAHIDELPSATVREVLDAIGRSARRMNSLIDELAQARKIGAAELSVVLEHCDVGALVRDAVADLSQVTSGRVVSVHSPEGIIAPLDPLRIRQVVGNLISNAAKFSPASSPIEINIETMDGSVRITVTDHGPGISPSRVHELFGKFNRLGATQQGVGLGLYISRAIARTHGGDVTLERSGPDGSVFVLSLPLSATLAKKAVRPNQTPS
ncbi:MAG: MASE1 domain-containing protein [Actinomycetota bacterium]|nr:MASE1 domain-containing protein [Actinomycetota bacterium]